MKYIVLDLEATCWSEKGLKRKSEIIEIGALGLNAAGEITQAVWDLWVETMHRENRVRQPKAN